MRAWKGLGLPAPPFVVVSAQAHGDATARQLHAKLVASGWSRIAQKVGEEGLEKALAGAGGSDGEVIEEVSDLLYHVLVLLKARGLTLERVIHELRGRHEELPLRSD